MGRLAFSVLVFVFLRAAICCPDLTSIDIGDLNPNLDGEIVTVIGRVEELELGPVWANFELVDSTGQVHIYWLFPGSPRTKPDWFDESATIQVTGTYYLEHPRHQWEPEIVALEVRPIGPPIKGAWTITPYGAAGEVAGSCYLVSNGSVSFLVDCGSFMNSEVEASESSTSTHHDSDAFDFDVSSVEAIIITHAHDDHVGRLHYFFYQNEAFDGPVFMTRATAVIYLAKLSDLIKYSELPDEKKGEIKSRVRSQVVCYDYLKEFDVVDGVTAMFVNAGHIPGSASVVLSLHDDSGPYWVTFSGDIGPGNHPFLNPPDLASLSETGTETLVIESTYGFIEREERPNYLSEFYTIIRETYYNGGLVVIPTFALDRTQRILASLVEGIRNGELPESLKIAVGGKSSCYLTNVYLTLQEDPSLCPMYFSNTFCNTHPLDVERWEYLRGADCQGEESPEEARDYDVVVTPSGTGGSSLSLELIKEYVSDYRTVFIKVGWAPPHSPMGQLETGTDRITIAGETYRVHAQVYSLHGVFSGHADVVGLLDYILAFPSLRKVIITHGEDRARMALAERIHNLLPSIEVVCPAYSEPIILREE